jgi:hypothetical protein
VFYACDERVTPISTSIGYKPVYSTQSTAITWEEPRELHHPGKIYEYGKYLLINEVNEGIHFFDNEDPAQPIAIQFLRIPGNTEMAIRNDVLYVNHMGNIVALAMGEKNSIVIQGTLPLASGNGAVLPPKGYYFECIEPENGTVINWVMTERKNMNCYAIP